MKYIDLLPKKEKITNRKTIALNVVIVFLIIIFALCILAVFFLNDINGNLSARLEKYEAANMELQGKINKLEIFEEFKNKVKDKKEIVDELNDGLILWSDIIYALGESMPEDTYIEGFDGNISSLQDYLDSVEGGEEVETDKITSFSIRGFAKEYKEMSNLIINIKSFPLIGDAWVENINKTTVSENVDAISFTINSFWELQPFIEDIEVEQPGEGVQSQDEDSESMVE